MSKALKPASTDDKRNLTSEVTKNFKLYVKDSLENHIAESSTDPSRIFFLRPSSFPYCGLKRFLDLPTADLNTRHENASSRYYTSVGTTTHTVFQEILGRKKQIVGDWHCPKCKAVLRNSFFKLCTKCGTIPNYEEMEMTYRSTLRGHPDGLFYDKKTKTYWVIDYKTTSSRKIYQHRKKSKVFPYGSNVKQITSYVPILEKMYKVNIRGWILIYLARDDPLSLREVVTKEMTLKDRARELKSIQRSIKVHRLFLRTKTLEQAMILQKYRLCKDLQDYTKNYADPYNECPHCKYCSDPVKVKEAAKKALASCNLYPLINHAPEKIRNELGMDKE